MEASEGEQTQTAEHAAKTAKKQANSASNARRAKGNDRTSEQIAAKKKANSKHIRAKGSDRSSKQIAAAKAANDKRERERGSDRSSEQITAAKVANDKRERERGSDRSSEQITAAKVANDERERGSDRSSEQITAAKAANHDRERVEGSERSLKQVAAVKKANEEYYASRPTKYEAKEKERRARWASYKRDSMTRFERLFEDANALWNNSDYEGALPLFQDAKTLIPTPDKYVFLNLVQYVIVHSRLGDIYYELGDLHGAIEAFNEALKFAAVKNATKHPPAGYRTQHYISLSSISLDKVRFLQAQFRAQ
jgi:tetratricopeptide (TPR) repeat protein